MGESLKVGERALSYPQPVSDFREPGTGQYLFAAFNLPRLPGNITVRTERAWQKREQLPELYRIGVQATIPNLRVEMVPPLGAFTLRERFYKEYGHATAIDVVLDPETTPKPHVLEHVTEITTADLLLKMNLWAQDHELEVLAWFKALRTIGLLKRENKPFVAKYGNTQYVHLTPKKTFTEQWLEDATQRGRKSK